MATIQQFNNGETYWSVRSKINTSLDNLNNDKQEETNGAMYGTTLLDPAQEYTVWADYWWYDLIWDITPKTSWVGAPSLDAFRWWNVRAFRYSVWDDGDCVFHMPHNYAPGTNLYIHLHWGHNGTAISWSLVVNFYVSYAKWHNQENFTAEKTIALTVSTPNIATVPQYRHRVDEVQLSTVWGSASLLDTSSLEVDWIILVHYDVATIPTITGGVGNEPFFFTIDIHYQASRFATKNKTPNFYT